MSQPRQITIMTGSIDYNKTVSLRQCINGIGECLASCGILRIIVLTEAKMVRDLEVANTVLSPSASILNIMGEASLSRIEIDGGDALAGLHQRNCDMHCNSGFARSALFIAHND